MSLSIGACRQVFPLGLQPEKAEVLCATWVPSAVWISPKKELTYDPGVLVRLDSQAWMPWVLVNPAAWASCWQSTSARPMAWPGVEAMAPVNE
jgi:hypothetical protein